MRHLIAELKMYSCKLFLYPWGKEGRADDLTALSYLSPDITIGDTGGWFRHSEKLDYEQPN